MYAKLFTSIYQGTLRGNSHGLLVFTNMLAHADKEGIVDIHPRAIAEEVGLSREQVRAAIEELEAPDEESRSPEEGGRRIIRIDEHRAWGWRVVNYVKYRAIRSEDDRREQNRIAQANWRAKQAESKQSKPASASISQHKPQSAHTEAEAEAEAKAIPGGLPGPPAPTAPSGKSPRKARGSKPAAPSANLWDAYSGAYQNRYGVPPVRNASVNAHLAQVVGKLGPVESPAVAAHFVKSQNGLYVSAMHPTNLLLRDAEKLRTEWATGRMVTRTQAQQADRTQTNFNSFAPLLAAAEAREAAERMAQND
jgi:hypothetical protein